MRRALAAAALAIACSGPSSARVDEAHDAREPSRGAGALDARWRDDTVVRATPPIVAQRPRAAPLSYPALPPEPPPAVPCAVDRPAEPTTDASPAVRRCATNGDSACVIRLLAGREPAQLSRVELAYLIDAHRARGEQHEALPLMRLYAARYRAPYR